MTQYTAANGTVFTDEDLEAWAADAENGFQNARFGASSPGRPVSIGDDARPLTVRLDAARRAKLKEAAEQKHTSVSQLVRDLIDAL
ncbi:MAG TPA: hypothetical protein PKE40_04910 [Arachnia sp.]|nr:hypothetical protein [Arachnia sp.]HMT85673.1 hypothetical protein [Arachnia sp.]